MKLPLLAASLVAIASFGLQAEVITPEFSAPVVQTVVAPDYPTFLREAGVTGSVLLEAVLGPDGVPSGIRVVSATNPAFAGAARTALASWEFLPALQNGEAVTMRVRVPMTFRLEESGRPARIEFGELAPAIALAR